MPVLVLAVAGMFFVRAQKRVAEQAEREKAAIAVTAYQQQLKLWLQHIPEEYQHPDLTREMLESDNSGVFEGDRPRRPELVSKTAEQCHRLIYEGKFNEAESLVASKNPNLKLDSGIPAMAVIYFTEANMTGKTEKWESWQSNNWPHSLTDLMVKKLDIKTPNVLVTIDYLRCLQSGFGGTFEGWIPISKQSGNDLKVIEANVLRESFESILATIPDRSPAYAMEVLLNDRPIFWETEMASMAPVVTGFSDGELGVVARLTHPEVLRAASETQAGWVMALIFSRPFRTNCERRWLRCCLF